MPKPAKEKTRAVVRTQDGNTMTLEGEGHMALPGALETALWVYTKAEREAILARLQKVHTKVCEAEAKWAERDAAQGVQS
jgi:hypothetical protein